MVQKGNKPENPSTKKCHMLKRVIKCLNKSKYMLLWFKNALMEQRNDWYYDVLSLDYTAC